MENFIIWFRFSQIFLLILSQIVLMIYQCDMLYWKYVSQIVKYNERKTSCNVLSHIIMTAFLLFPGMLSKNKSFIAESLKEYLIQTKNIFNPDRWCYQMTTWHSHLVEKIWAFNNSKLICGNTNFICSKIPNKHFGAHYRVENRILHWVKTFVPRFSPTKQ